jgi:hypothetical protein
MKKLNMLLLAALCTGTAQAADLLTAYQDALAYDAQFAVARAALGAGAPHKLLARRYNFGKGAFTDELRSQRSTTNG